MNFRFKQGSILYVSLLEAVYRLKLEYKITSDFEHSGDDLVQIDDVVMTPEKCFELGNLHGILTVQNELKENIVKTFFENRYR